MTTNTKPIYNHGEVTVCHAASSIVGNFLKNYRKTGICRKNITTVRKITDTVSVSLSENTEPKTWVNDICCRRET